MITGNLHVPFDENFFTTILGENKKIVILTLRAAHTLTVTKGNFKMRQANLHFGDVRGPLRRCLPRGLKAVES